MKLNQKTLVDLHYCNQIFLQGGNRQPVPLKIPLTQDVIRYILTEVIPCQKQNDETAECVSMLNKIEAQNIKFDYIYLNGSATCINEQWCYASDIFMQLAESHLISPADVFAALQSCKLDCKHPLLLLNIRLAYTKYISSAFRCKYVIEVFVMEKYEKGSSEILVTHCDQTLLAPLLYRLVMYHYSNKLDYMLPLESWSKVILCKYTPS